MSTITWTYYTAYCSFKITKKGGLFSSGEGHWILMMEKEYGLDEGLKHLGKNGYELIAIHKTWEAYGGQSGGSYNPTYIYIFKQPLHE